MEDVRARRFLHLSIIQRSEPGPGPLVHPITGAPVDLLEHQTQPAFRLITRPVNPTPELGPVTVRQGLVAHIKNKAGIVFGQVLRFELQTQSRGGLPRAEHQFGDRLPVADLSQGTGRKPQAVTIHLPVVPPPPGLNKRLDILLYKTLVQPARLEEFTEVVQ